MTTAEWAELDTRPQPPRRENSKDKAAREQREQQAAAAAEALRLQKREVLKQRRAQALLADQQRQEFDVAIEGVESKKEQFASDHVENARQLQARLKAIEEQQISAIKSRLPADAAIEAERQGLLDQLQAMNAALEESIRREDSVLSGLRDERFKVATRYLLSDIEGDLLQLTSLPARAALYVAQSAGRWAKARYDRANERHGAGASALTAAELSEAGRLLSEATSAEHAAVRNCIEE